MRDETNTSGKPLVLRHEADTPEAAAPSLNPSRPTATTGLAADELQDSDLDAIAGGPNGSSWLGAGRSPQPE